MFDLDSIINDRWGRFNLNATVFSFVNEIFKSGPSSTFYWNFRYGSFRIENRFKLNNRFFCISILMNGSSFSNENIISVCLDSLISGVLIELKFLFHSFLILNFYRIFVRCTVSSNIKKGEQMQKIKFFEKMIYVIFTVQNISNL